MELATGTVLKSVVGNLGSFVAQEYALIKGIRGEVQFLSDELSSLKAYIGSLIVDSDSDDEGHVNTEEQLSDVERQAREVAFDIQDCIDEFDHHLIKGPNGDGFFSAARRFLHDAGACFSRHDMAAKIAELKARLQHIAERRVRYGMVGDDAGRGTRKVNGGISGGIPGTRTGNECGVVCLTGPGGMGKTIRAMQLFQELGDAFHLRAWVTIPHQFNIFAVVRSIVRQIMSQADVGTANDGEDQGNSSTSGNRGHLNSDVETMTGGQLDELLGKLLRDKRYLICIDDLPSISTWEAINQRLPQSNLGRRIIVTTRFPPVAAKCREAGLTGVTCTLAYPVSAESAKQIFEGSLADILGDREHGGTLLEVKDSILDTCNRQPLLIVLLAGFVASNSRMSPDRMARLLLPPSRDGDGLVQNSVPLHGLSTSSSSSRLWDTLSQWVNWATILPSPNVPHLLAPSLKAPPPSNPSANQSELDGNRMLDIFFHNLPSDVKVCLLYLSLFPKACTISSRRLTRHWIAQGLVGEVEVWSAENVADACFEELIRTNMVRPVERSSTGKVKTCQVHTTVLEYIITKSTKENFTTVIGDYWSLPIMSSSMKVRRLSLRGSDQQVYKRRGNHSLLDLSHVRVVTASGPLEQLPFLPFELKIVQVLDLEGCTGLRRQDVKAICKMLLLKYLSLRKTDVDKLPSGIGKLKYLETLDIRESNVSELPKSAVRLRRIESILGGSKRGRKALKLPEDMMNRPIRSLNILSGIEIDGESTSVPRLDNFVGIRKLAIYKLRIKEPLLIGSLFSSSLQSLVIVDEFSNFLNSLEGLSILPRSLRSLKLYGELYTLPHFTAFLQFLKKLSLPMTVIGTDNTIKTLGELPSLVSLTFSFAAPHIHWDTEDIIERVEPQGEITFPSNGFRSLKLLRFSAPSLPALRFAEGAAPEVERLELQYEKLEGLSGVRNLCKIQEVHFFVKAQAREGTRHIVDAIKNRAGWFVCRGADKLMAIATGEILTCYLLVSIRNYLS
ncbi:unnamed protein product [Urochloa decumbens]|uniref:AAA+ ATPase domain-containing protein n=1 Tax=Urochloa decumbens TaxID=240449 RepID=A0ABC9B135_9POAL